MFTLIVSILNAASWSVAYLYFGVLVHNPEYHPSTYTPEYIFAAFAMIVLCSAISGLVSLHCTHVFDSFLLNTLHNIITTTMVSAPLVLLLFRKTMEDPGVLGWGEFIWCVIAYAVAYFAYFCFFIAEECGFDVPLQPPLWARLLIVVLVTYYASSIPTVGDGTFAFGCGFLISIPMSIVLSIRSKITD